MAFMAKNNSGFGHRSLVLAILGAASSIGLGVRADSPKTVTAEEVRILQKKYQAERAEAENPEEAAPDGLRACRSFGRQLCH